MMERVLSLDVSSKTGWALLLSGDDSYSLEAYGQIPKSSEPDGKYPINYVDWAEDIFKAIKELIVKYLPDVLVIEETAGGSKSAHSQKILEFIHFLIAKQIKDTEIKAIYFMTEEWRRIVGCTMTKEESKHNKYVKEYKKKTGLSRAKDDKGKAIGKLTRKHINVRRANELLGQFFVKPLQKKDEDTADASLLAVSYHLKKVNKRKIIL